MILVIDNYDSFTFNLVQYLGEVAAVEISVARNDTLSIADVRAAAPSHIVLSPGPCSPNEAGISIELVKAVSGEIPLLGVCLGHQAIGQAFGGKVVRAAVPVHGKTSNIVHSDDGIFEGLPNPFIATRYHSLAVERASLPSCLRETAWVDEEIMALAHTDHAFTIGVQFHPESIMTHVGKELLRRFVATTYRS